MNWLDIIIIVTIVIAGVIGLWVGLIRAVLSLAGLVVGVILAGRYYLPLSEKLSFIPQAAVAKVVAFTIILLGVMAITFVLAWLLNKVASVAMLGWVNRLGGAVFGLILGIVIWGAILAAWVRFFGTSGAITDSILAGGFLDYLPLGLGLLPGDFAGDGFY
jgi:membrane protein required for colicin V production